MTKHKDQKRIIRARMKKTGESYTAARAVVVSREKAPAPKYAAPRKEWPALAGQSDAKMIEQTGRPWAEWVEELNAARAFELSHRDIARHVSRTHPEIGGWWVQCIAVGYERIAGLRDVGQRRDGGYDANKSRTFAANVATVYRMFEDPRRRKKWLEGATRVRTATANKTIRFDWSDGTRVTAYFVPSKKGGCTLAIQHEKLPSKIAVEQAKRFWTDRLDFLKQTLE